MANFITSLGKGFIRSAVNQVGRDYGKTISNQVFGDAHATPVRMVKTDASNIVYRPGIPNNENAVEYHKQDILNWQDIVCLILSPLCIFFGPFLYGAYSCVYLFSSKTRFIVYSDAPKRIIDRRFSCGYRTEYQGVHKELIEVPNFMLDKNTILKGKIRGIVWLVATAITITTNILLLKLGMK